MIEKTVNADAVVYIVKNASSDSDEILNGLFNIDTVERDVVIFDLSRAENVTSRFISTLANIQKQLDDGKKKFIISGASQSIKNMLTCTGMTSLFKIL